MTIHSDWGKLLYNECPQAFHEKLNHSICKNMNAGIIDGHLQLMCLDEKFGTWERFIQIMFLSPIRDLLRHCKTVVLCFDFYDKVPVYKRITQTKRANSKPSCKFESHESLPDRIPPDAINFLMNRTFKLKIIDMLCTRIPFLVHLESDQEFIIDYKRVIKYDASSKGIPKVIPSLVPMGESDVKFTRYVQIFGNCLVHAIDGDYIVIALLYYKSYGIKDNNKIYIYRQNSFQSKKRALNEDDQFKQSDAAKPKAKKVWVDIQLIYLTLERCIEQSIRTDQRFFPDQRKDHYMSVVVFMMLCAGTDFSRALPLLGPCRLWECLPYVSQYGIFAFENEDQIIDVLKNLVVNIVYKTLFAKHIKGKCSTWTETKRSIDASNGLSSTTKQRIPEEIRIDTTLRNILWVMRYWSSVNANIDTPLDGSNGFISGSHCGSVAYNDCES